MKRIKTKLQKQIGESLIETLAALLIAALGLTLLPGAIVAAARVNHKAEENSFTKKEVSDPPSSSGTITIGADTLAGASVNIYQQQSGVYYYTAQ